MKKTLILLSFIVTIFGCSRLPKNAKINNIKPQKRRKFLSINRKTSVPKNLLSKYSHQPVFSPEKKPDLAIENSFNIIEGISDLILKGLGWLSIYSLFKRGNTQTDDFTVNIPDFNLLGQTDVEGGIVFFGTFNTTDNNNKNISQLVVGYGDENLNTIFCDKRFRLGNYTMVKGEIRRNPNTDLIIFSGFEKYNNTGVDDYRSFLGSGRAVNNSCNFNFDRYPFSNIWLTSADFIGDGFVVIGNEIQKIDNNVRQGSVVRRVNTTKGNETHPVIYEKHNPPTPFDTSSGYESMTATESVFVISRVFTDELLKHGIEMLLFNAKDGSSLSFTNFTGITPAPIFSTPSPTSTQNITTKVFDLKSVLISKEEIVYLGALSLNIRNTVRFDGDILLLNFTSTTKRTSIAKININNPFGFSSPWTSLQNEGSHITLHPLKNDPDIIGIGWTPEGFVFGSQGIDSYRINSTNGDRYIGATQVVLLPESEQLDSEPEVKVTLEKGEISCLFGGSKGDVSVLSRKFVNLLNRPNGCTGGFAVSNFISGIPSNNTKINTTRWVNQSASEIPTAVEPWDPDPEGEKLRLEPVCGPTLSPTATTATPSQLPSQTPSSTPSKSPSMTPSSSPSQSPSSTPSKSPSMTPSSSPSKSPSSTPSKSPSMTPSSSPSKSPSTTPSSSPSQSPSSTPSKSPSMTPSSSPSKSPSSTPSKNPSMTPSSSPSKSPSMPPSSSPSQSPTEGPTVSKKKGGGSDPDVPLIVTITILSGIVVGICGGGLIYQTYNWWKNRQNVPEGVELRDESVELNDLIDSDQTRGSFTPGDVVLDFKGL